LAPLLKLLGSLASLPVPRRHGQTIDPGVLAFVGSTCAIFEEFLVGHHECKLQ